MMKSLSQGMLSLSLVMCGLGISQLAFAKGDPAKGKSKAITCAACHGQGGNSTNPMYPTIAGKDENFIFTQLQDFKSGKRNTPNAALMKPMAAPLSEQDMHDLAAYFASEKPAGAASGGRRRGN